MLRTKWILAGLFAFCLSACQAPHAGAGREIPAAVVLPDLGIVPALPVIPATQFDLKDFGGVGDGIALNTAAFAKAVAAIEKAGGGHLNVSAGTYKTLRFALTSKMDLHLDKGATIKFPDNFEDYGIPKPLESGAEAGGFGARGQRAALITAPPNSSDIAITGEGTIDGSGAIYWLWSDKNARKFPPGRTVVGRPHLINMVGVKRLHVEGVTLTNSPMYHLVPKGEDITIENVRIFAPDTAPNTDAINVGGRRILIRNCHIDSGDDNVALQSGSQDVRVENLTCLHGHGISIGSGTRNGLSHVFVRHCTFNGTLNGLRIKSYRGNGGEVHDINYSDIAMKNVRRPFDINLLYNGNANVTSDVGLRASNGNTQNLPDVHDIHITDLSVEHCPVAGRIIGLPEQNPHGIIFTNATFKTERGFLVQDAKDVVFENVKIENAAGEPLVLDNASVKLNGAEKNGTSGGSPEPFYPGN